MCPRFSSTRRRGHLRCPHAPRRPTTGPPCTALLCMAMAGFSVSAQASVDNVATFDEVTIESSFGLDLRGSEGLTLLEFDDDFEESVLDDDRWMVFTEHGSCTIEAGRLRQEITSWVGGDSYATVVPRFNFPGGGNFDLEARFDVSGFANQNAWFAAMRITIPGAIEAEVIRGYNNSQHSWSSQCRYWLGNHWGPWTQQQWTTEDVTTEGWLGFDRPDGQTLRAWYRGSGDWIQYATFSECGGEASVSLTTNNWIYHATGATLWDDFRVNIPAEPYLWEGEAVRSPRNAGGPVEVTGLSWDAVVPDGTSLGFQLRTAPDAGGTPGSWSVWYGPDGEESWFFETPAVVAYTPEDAQWLQWRVRLGSSDGSTTPLLRSVETHYGFVPVELSCFQAAWTDEGIRVSWTTASEMDNVSFEVVHRARDTDAWHPITEPVQGAGTSTTSRSYHVIHRDASRFETHMYLLRDIDTRGTATTHGPVIVPPTATNVLLSPNAPEPFSTATAWRVCGLTPDFSASIVDLGGRTIGTVCAVHGACGTELRWDATEQPSGVYVLMLRAGSTVITDPCLKLP